MNILPLVMQYFGPVIMNKIAGSLGINSTLAQRAIALAAPAILAGLIGKATQPGGAKILSDIIAKQDPSLLGKLGEMIGTGKQAGVVEQGTSALGSLLGNSQLGSLAGALSKQVGLGAGASNTLLGLMAPAVLGTLGKEQRSAGLDAAGLANMLMGQKQAIADAIPADFAKLLAGTGLLDAVQSKTGEPVIRPAVSQPANGGARPVTTAAATSTMAAKPAMATGKPAAAMPIGMEHHHHFNWMPWIVGIAAASTLWWLVFGERAMRAHETATSIPAVVAPSTTLATTRPLPDILAKTDIGKLLASTIEDTRGAVSGIRDGTSAQAALPRIQQVATQLDTINGMAAKAPPDIRRAVASYLAPQTGMLKTVIGNAMALAGVSAVLKPTLDQVVSKFDALAKI